MSELICLFQDYLSALSPVEKMSFLRKADVRIVASAAESIHRDETEANGGGFDVPRDSYKRLIQELRARYGRNAPSAFSALMVAGPEAEPARNLSDGTREALYYVHRLGPEAYAGSLPWAADPRNWYLVESEASPVTVQSQIGAQFPCNLFPNGPVECAAPADPSLQLERLDDVLQSTGIYGLWRHGNLGQGASCVVLDTGAEPRLMNDGVDASAVGGLSETDQDGHGTAVIGLIRAISPRTNVESICVSQSYSGGQIWNLISGLSQLYQRADTIINLSLGVSPDWVRSLGPQALGFKEALSNLLASLGARHNFAVGAAGNDGLPDLRWPAASPDALAVGSHNTAFHRSSFSNYRLDAPNLVFAPGGEVRSMDGRVEGFGRYGSGLSRDVFGTSFSTAVASAMSCLLMAYGWFQSMEPRSRISLFKNHCRQNQEGLAILNLVDVGAVWPLTDRLFFAPNRRI